MKLPSMLIFAISILMASCQNSDRSAQAATAKSTNASAQETNANFTSIRWIDSILDKGTINEGEKIELLYRFRNTGDKPLVIEDVRPSCGCTVVDKPEKPVAPGEEGIIRAEFDSHNKVGPNTKTVFVRSNTPQRTSNLVFTVTVNKQ